MLWNSPQRNFKEDRRKESAFSTRWAAWQWQQVKCQDCLHSSAALDSIPCLQPTFIQYNNSQKQSTMFHWSPRERVNTLMSKNQSARRGHTPWWFLWSLVQTGILSWVASKNPGKVCPTFLVSLQLLRPITASSPKGKDKHKTHRL